MKNKFSVFSLAVLLLISTVALVDFSQTAEGIKAQGTTNPKFGSETADKVCGDKLCSEVEQISSSEKKYGDPNVGKASQLLENQIMVGKYKITVDWIHEFPVTDESNGFEILVSDTSIKAEHGKHGDKGSHGDKAKHGTSSHGDKGSHGDKAKHGTSSHDDKGDCRCIKLLKSSIPQAELFENGVGGLEDNLKIIISSSGESIQLPLSADELNGKYYVLFVPTVSGQYDVELNGMIGKTSINHSFSPDRVIEKSELIQFP